MYKEKSERLQRELPGGYEGQTSPNPQATPRQPPGNPQATPNQPPLYSSKIKEI